MNKQNDPTKQKIEKVEWFGVDGLLCLLYAVLGTIYSYGIINRIDFIVGIMAPCVAITITVLVFLRYCTEVLNFTHKSNKK
ncbi:MAG: hypothetical protein ACK5L0_04425 [Candidatus Fimivivens sp.]